MNHFAGLVSFILNSDQSAALNHDSYEGCAVGLYAKSVGEDPDKMVTLIADQEDMPVANVLDMRGKYAMTNAKFKLMAYLDCRGASERTMGEMANTLRTHFPTLVEGL